MVLAIDGHTCDNPAPMFEPRGHDLMSGAMLYLPTRADCDLAILFIETIGCLPMCGHGTTAPANTDPAAGDTKGRG